jgi:hypothetical protein
MTVRDVVGAHARQAFPLVVAPLAGHVSRGWRPSPAAGGEHGLVPGNVSGLGGLGHTSYGHCRSVHHLPCYRALPEALERPATARAQDQEVRPDLGGLAACLAARMRRPLYLSRGMGRHLGKIAAANYRHFMLLLLPPSAVGRGARPPSSARRPRAPGWPCRDTRASLGRTAAVCRTRR